MRTRLVLISFFMLVYIAVAIATILYYVTCSESGDVPYLHGLFNLIAMLFLALAICIFRMIQLMPTRMVKIIHVIFHILVLGFMTLSYYPIFLKQSRLREVSYHHAFPAFVMYAVYLFQFLMGLILLMLLFGETAGRIFAAPFHNIVGVWIYVCMVGIAMTGWYHERYTNSEEFYRQHRIYTLCLMSSTFLVMGLVLFPYFQWELVGDL